MQAQEHSKRSWSAVALADTPTHFTQCAPPARLFLASLHRQGAPFPRHSALKSTYARRTAAVNAIAVPRPDPSPRSSAMHSHNTGPPRLMLLSLLDTRSQNSHHRWR